MLSCVFDDDPCLFIENMPTYWKPGAPPESGKRIPLGKANIARPGRDVTLVSYSRTVTDCLMAAEKLSKEGVDCEVIDLRTVAPWDSESVLKSVARTRRGVIVHEAVKPFGVGAEIASRINEELFGELAAPVQRVGACHSPVPFSKKLETEFVPTLARIESAIRATLD
jgi:pyruvate dehydrogenase E1 component beta subunit